MTQPDLNNIHYAPWLEKALQELVAFPNVRGLCMGAVTETGDTYVNYYQFSMADKITLAGYIQQDAMLDTLRANDLIPSEDEDEDEEDED